MPILELVTAYVTPARCCWTNWRQDWSARERYRIEDAIAAASDEFLTVTDFIEFNGLPRLRIWV